jgi:hypothetical protein
MLSDIPGARNQQIQLCQDCVVWAIEEKRIYLRQSLETRLIALFLENRQFTDALKLIGTLLSELKRLDDKMLLVEVQLLESKVCLQLRNIPKAKVKKADFFSFLLFFIYRFFLLSGVTLFAGCFDLCSHVCQRDLLSSPSSGEFGYPIWNSPR